MAGTLTVRPHRIAGNVWEADRVQAMPLDHGARGHYRMAVVTGDIAAGAGAAAEFVQFRWTSATILAAILDVEVTGMRASTAFAAGAIDITATIARSFTVAGTGGGAATITGNNGKARTSHATTALGELRTATTAALGAGTKTLDAQPIGNIITHSSAGPNAATPIIGSIYLPKTKLIDADVSDGAHPVLLAQNEGLIIRATVPATGVWNLGLSIVWAEVETY
jgi:hypothetical protein